MQPKHLPFHLAASLSIGFGLIAPQTSVLAQEFPADTGGIMFYDGGVVAGIGIPVRGGRALLQFASTTQQDAVNNAAATLLSALSNGTLTGLSNESIPGNIQQNLLTLLTNPTSVSKEAFVNALVTAGTSTVEAQALANYAAGLIHVNKSVVSSNMLACVSDCQTAQASAPATVEAAKLLAAVKAYNPVINSASEQFLRNPPPEILAIRRVLSDLVQAATPGSD